MRRLPVIAFSAVIASLALFLLLILGGLASGAVASQRAEQKEARGNRRNFPLSRFYDTPNPLPAGRAGELIRSQEFDEYDIPLHANAVRILYHSRSASGQDVAASGIVLYPDAKPPSGGWPIVAWAHALTGVARDCAPSLERNMQHGAFLTMYVNLGYAVVATDYVGLGTNFRNAFSDALSNGADVIYSVPAARAAVPQLGSRWVAIGLEDGGAVAIKVSEMESDTHDANLLGSIAISNLDDPQDRYEHANSSSAPGSVFFLAYGIKTVFPKFDPKVMLSDKAMQWYPMIEKACAAPNVESKPSTSELLKPDWQRNGFVQQFFEQNALGHRRAATPVLVISSGLNPSVPIQRTAMVVRRMCSQQDYVDFERYAQSDPSQVFGDSVREQISWLQQRFSGETVPGNCGEQ